MKPVAFLLLKIDDLILEGGSDIFFVWDWINNYECVG